MYNDALFCKFIMLKTKTAAMDQGSSCSPLKSFHDGSWNIEVLPPRAMPKNIVVFM